MGYWNSVAADIERVLGDELNPTDAYGRPLIIKHDRKIPLGSSDLQGFERKWSELSAIPKATIRAGYQVSDAEKGGNAIPVPELPFPFPPIPGFRR